MAIACRVRDADLRRQWFTVEDDGNEVWRFERTDEVAESAAIPQVSWENRASGNASVPVLLRGSDGQVLLRQDAPGVPERAVVKVDDLPAPGPGGLFTTTAFFTATVIFVRANS